MTLEKKECSGSPLPGISPSGEDYSNFGRAEVEEELLPFLKRLNEWRARYHHTSPLSYAYDASAGVCAYAAHGRKYVRIVLKTPAIPSLSDQAYGFVRLSDGALLRAQTWKSPYTGTSCVRGYIFDQDVSLACDFYSVRYVR